MQGSSNAFPPRGPRPGPSPLWPLAIVLGFVLLEIFGFAWIGGEVGALWTVFLVVLTSVLGIALVRVEGLRHLAQMQAMLARGEPPGAEVIEIWLLVLAGVLLVVPGFFSDAGGLLLLLPPVRRALARRWYRGAVSARERRAERGRTRGQVLEGEWRPSADESDHAAGHASGRGHAAADARGEAGTGVEASYESPVDAPGRSGSKGGGS